MRKAEIYWNKDLAGILKEESGRKYVFTYTDSYFIDNSKPAISLTLPKTKKEFSNKFLFPFFFNLLSEGVNRKLQCRQLKIDPNDHFGLLIATAQYDTIGAISAKIARI